MTEKYNCVFIFGSPRSGTTLLENLLNHHRQIAEWYEPYYLWERFFPVPDTDTWQIEHLTKQVRKKIRSEFGIYSKKSGKAIIVDKTPPHAFNLKIIHKIFPEAKFIHILRDGRDVTLSIKKEWGKRVNIVREKNLAGQIQLIKNMLKRQPYWRYRFMAISHELQVSFATGRALNLKKLFNKARWKGEPGWGPRFNDWQTYLKSHTPIEFNAMQWVQSVEAVFNSWSDLPEKNKIEIRYEDLIQSPQHILQKLFDLIDVDVSSVFFNKIPDINHQNFNKWKTELSHDEIEKIKPILTPLINRLGYDKKYPW